MAPSLLAARPLTALAALVALVALVAALASGCGGRGRRALAGLPDETARGPSLEKIEPPLEPSEAQARVPGGRTMLSRPLYATASQNLLIDPLVVVEGGTWGHFDSFFGPSTPGAPTPELRPSRLVLSASPPGASATVASFEGLSRRRPAQRSARSIARFAGATGPVTASLWVSPGDGEGGPARFAVAKGKLGVALFSPDSSEQYPLLAGPPVSIGGREWVKVKTPAPGPSLPRGGWFVIDIVDLDSSWLFAAPEVTCDVAH